MASQLNENIVKLPEHSCLLTEISVQFLSQRLKWALARKGERDGCVYRAADLMRKTGASRTAVSFWMKDVNGIEGDNARKAAAFLGVDPVWLETGEGEPDPVKREIEMSLAMRRELVNAEELAQLFALYAQSTETGRRQILNMALSAEKFDIPASSARHKPK